MGRYSYNEGWETGPRLKWPKYSRLGTHYLSNTVKIHLSLSSDLLILMNHLTLVKLYYTYIIVILGDVQSQDKLLEVNTSTSIIVKYPEESFYEKRCLVTDYFLERSIMWSTHGYLVDYLGEFQELCLCHQAVRTHWHKAAILGSDLRLRQTGSV